MTKFERTRSTAGFTLIELMIVVAILSVVMLLISVVVQTSNSSLRLASAKGAAADEAREALWAMLGELQYARKNPGIATGDTYVEVIESPDVRLPDCAKIAVQFQLPTDDNGETFTEPISYRWMNEDDNNNGKLDSGEDTLIADGRLTRKLVRVGEADTGGGMVVFERPVAGSVDISDVEMTLEGNTLEITVASTKEVPGTKYKTGSTVNARYLTSRITGRVFLHN